MLPDMAGLLLGHYVTITRTSQYLLHTHIMAASLSFQKQARIWG